MKYFVQVKMILSRPVHDAALDREEDEQDSGADDNKDNEQEESADENEGVAEVIGGQQEIVLWR